MKLDNTPRGSYVHRIFCEDETGLFAKLLYHEVASPTLALEKIANDVLFPQNEHVAGIIRRALGPDVREDVLFLCKHSIIGPCAFYNFSRPLRERVIGRKTMSEEEKERTARHVARFSLGGLKETEDME